MKVFIVEDDPIIVEGLKIALTQESYEVESYGNMTDAIKHSNYIFSVADFGEIHDADGIITCVADDDANIEYYDDEIDEVLRRESDEGKIHSI